MAEYYAVLSKAVAGLEANSPEARRAVYDKARNALIGQLKAIDPPLPTAEISRQRLELEEAIRRVERETSAIPAGAPVRVARPVAAATVTPPPQAATPPRQAPQDVFRRAIQEAERDTADEPRLERAPVGTAKIDTSWASERIDRVPPPARPTQSYLPSQGYVAEEPRGDEPRLAPDYDHEWSPDVVPGPLGNDIHQDGRDAPPKGRRAGRRARTADDDDMELPDRPSRLPTILLLLLIVAMIGGLGALGWSQRDVVADIMAGILPASDSGSAREMPSAGATQVVDESGKDTGRLLDGGATETGSNARIVDADQGAVGDPIGQKVTNAAVEPGALALTDPNDGGLDQDALVAQRAVLYEEPLDAAAAAAGVVAINATVTWSFLPNGINGAEVVGNIDVPERGMKIKLAIRRNTDDTLPASHIVEVVVDTPADFPGRSIRDVPRVVFKPNEEARGQPLIGASARVADGFFWIALSSVSSDLRTNIDLLNSRLWIDLPLLYESGQRAILTLDKGTPGERVFQRALAAWDG